MGRVFLWLFISFIPVWTDWFLDHVYPVEVTIFQWIFFYSQNVHVHVVDMSSARQVWEFAQSFSQTDALHVLVGKYAASSVRHTSAFYSKMLTTCRVHQINNAGCMVNQRELTEEGLEKNFATNTLGNEKKLKSNIWV